MRKKLFTLTLLLGLLQCAWADNVTYIKRTWDDNAKTVKSESLTANATKLTSSTTSLSDGWYYVEGEVNMGTLNIEGTDVHLILADGCQLNCKNIKLEVPHVLGNLNAMANKKLSIYAQSGEGTRGQLMAISTDEGTAGIGGTTNHYMGNLTVHGGVLTVQGGKRAAGIGSGWYNQDPEGHWYQEPSGYMTVYDGNISSIGGEGGAGIGGGCGYKNIGQRGLEYVQYGGWVAASGGELAAGLGGGGSYHTFLSNINGNGGALGKTTIYGGILSATGGHRGAGIGSGSCQPDPFETDMTNVDHVNSYRPTYLSPMKFDVTINGGIVTATGGNYGAGIGGGCNVQGCMTEINGGEVLALGGKDAAGIGGGEDGRGMNCTITGGKVKAFGGGYGAGIGGGDNGLGGVVCLYGGIIEAKAGDECKATKAKCGSAIGCGDGVSAKDDNEYNGITMIDTLRVSAGSSETDVEHNIVGPDREYVCHWRQYVKVEPCDHPESTYSVVSETAHRHSCKYCLLDDEEEHLMENCPCGHSLGTWTITYHHAPNIGILYEPKEDITVKVGKGKAAQLMAPKEFQSLDFIGWAIDPAEVPATTYVIEKEPGLLAAGADFTPTKDVHAYARYRIVYDDKWIWSDDKKSCKVELTDRLLHQTLTYDATVRTEEQEASFMGKGYTLHIAEYEQFGFTYADYLYDWKYYMVNMKDNEDNTNELAFQTVLHQEIEVKYDRVLSASKQPDGTWKPKAYTVSLPYEVQLSDTYSDQFMVYHLTNVDLEKRELTFIHDFPILKPREAYVIVVNEGTLSLDAKGVIINSSEANGEEVYNPDGSATLGWWRPVMKAKSAEQLAQDRGYLLRSDGTFTRVKPTDTESLPAFRAYFSLSDDADIESFKTKFVIISDGEDDDQVVDINFFDDDSTAGIQTIHSTGSQPARNDNSYYDLQGRRLNGTPNQPGVYIRNGKKIYKK